MKVKTMKIFLVFFGMVAMLTSITTAQSPMGGGGKIRFTSSVLFGEFLGSSEEESDEQKGPMGDKIASSPAGKESSVISKYMNDQDITLIQQSWNEHIKQSPDFASKVFLKYFKAKPEAQKLFPAFADVPYNQLETNKAFLHQVYTCITSLNFILPHLNKQTECIEKCEALQKLKHHYHQSDLERFGQIWLDVIQEELGNDFTPEVKSAWKNGIAAFNDYASKPK